MRILLQKLKMVKGVQEVACLRSEAYSKYIRPAGYREAVKALNLLQTNASVLQEVRRKRKQGLAEKHDKLLETYKYLSRTGVSLEELDALPVIHVAGTKGKGSTCAFCESMLRYWARDELRKTNSGGLQPTRTGLYTSPHLVEVRERIQLDGKPISQELFALHFWDVYNALMEKREHEGDMPPYFKFLTVLAFNVFIKEGVDVAVVEVGIGGEFDCTNIIRKPIAVGITSLGIDHTSILGETLEEIAWQKAGIMKKGAPAFTAFDQDPAALAVLKKRADEKEVNLKVCPPLSSYFLDDCGSPLDMIMQSKVQEVNASLALQLANTWIEWHHNSGKNGGDFVHSELTMAPPFKIESSLVSGLRNCRWPGRMQILHLPSGIPLNPPISHHLSDCDTPLTFFLDGAHTFESIRLCLEWFKNASYSITSCKEREITKRYFEERKPDNPLRVLLFNTTGDRDVEVLLSPLAKSKLFDLALFSTNSPTQEVDPHSDLINVTVYQEQQHSRCEEHLRVWLKYNDCTPAQVHPCVSDALASLKSLSQTISSTKNKCRNIQILASGSLHLVGSVLSIIDPNLSSFHPSDENGKCGDMGYVFQFPEKSHDPVSSSSAASVQCNSFR